MMMPMVVVMVKMKMVMVTTYCFITGICYIFRSLIYCVKLFESTIDFEEIETVCCVVKTVAIVHRSGEKAKTIPELKAKMWPSFQQHLEQSPEAFPKRYFLLLFLQEHKSAKTVGEMKQYVQRIPFMQRAKASLAIRELMNLKEGGEGKGGDDGQGGWGRGRVF